MRFWEMNKETKTYLKYNKNKYGLFRIIRIGKTHIFITKLKGGLK